MAPPKPKVVSEVCSLCGLDWKLHGKTPTAETCVGLLLNEVRSLNAQLSVRPIMQPIPYPAPYPVYPRPLWTTWSGVATNGASQQVWNTSVTVRQPNTAYATPQAIAASSVVAR